MKVSTAAAFPRVADAAKAIPSFLLPYKGARASERGKTKDRDLASRGRHPDIAGISARSKLYTAHINEREALSFDRI